MASKNTKNNKKEGDTDMLKVYFFLVLGMCGVFLLGIYLVGYSNIFALEYSRADAAATNVVTDAVKAVVAPVQTLDTVAYDKKMLQLANVKISTSTATSTANASTTAKRLWPAKPNVYPNVGAVLPFKRIIAYYGNFYAKGMGVLGQYPEAEMLSKLKAEIANWNAADPSTPAIPAIDYITVTAQGSAGFDGKYRARMPDSQMDHAVELANKINGIVILDVQVGLSTVQTEVPLLEKYLKMPNVELALDPEFDMHNGAKPGSVIGSMDASEINFAANYLAKLVQENNLPPKVLIIHRFTENMVTNYKLIKPLPEVQMVMDMDGWGFGAKKINTYNQIVYPEPVQFTGFKLFYKNDVKPPSTHMLTPAEVLKLTPQPVFIQYQ